MFKVKTQDGLQDGSQDGLRPEDLAGVYKDIADVIGVDATLRLHNNFYGQQMNLPKKLYTKEYVVRLVKKAESGFSVKEIAHQCGYTERRLRQIVKEADQAK